MLEPLPSSRIFKCAQKELTCCTRKLKTVGIEAACCQRFPRVLPTPISSEAGLVRPRGIGEGEGPLQPHPELMGVLVRLRQGIRGLRTVSKSHSCGRGSDKKYECSDPLLNDIPGGRALTRSMSAQTRFSITFKFLGEGL